MVGIVGILLLGSLAWSAVGQLFAALSEASSSLAPRPTPTRLPTAVAVVATVPVVPVVPTATLPPRLVTTPAPTVVMVPTPTLLPATPTPEKPAGRAPWILLPRPPPGSHVPPGQVTIEARGRGDAPIASVGLELDGAPLEVSLEQRGQSIWRGFATARVGVGQHAVHATVVDTEGRGGGYRWSFEAS